MIDIRKKLKRNFYVRNFKAELKKRGLRNVKVTQKGSDIFITFIANPDKSSILFDKELNTILEIQEKLRGNLCQHIT